MEHCPICAGAVALGREVREVVVGKRRASVEHEFYRCGTCGEEFMEPAMMDAVLVRAAAKIREAAGTLAPHEISAIRRDLGYTQTEFEAVLNTGAKTVTRWERGTVAPTGPADTLLRLFGRHPELAHEIAEQKGLRRHAASR